METPTVKGSRTPWNKEKLVGQKRPFKLKEIWAIRVRLQLSCRTRELALFNLGIDSKLRACDLVKLHVRDVATGDRAAARASVVQQKTGRPVQFELTQPTREAVGAWIAKLSFGPRTSFSPAALPHRRILERGSTQESSTAGSQKSAWIPKRTEPTPCGGPKRHWCIDARRTCAPYSCCSDTPSWKARFAIWASKLKTPWRWLSKPTPEAAVRPALFDRAAFRQNAARSRRLLRRQIADHRCAKLELVGNVGATQTQMTGSGFRDSSIDSLPVIGEEPPCATQGLVSTHLTVLAWCD